jgi:large subunit ribosomal protein L15
MELHTLQSHGQQRKRRLGQGHGSGRGKTSGRGTKGQKARGDIPLRFEGGALVLVKRIPFLRGKDRNKSFRPRAIAINLSELTNLDQEEVTVDMLIQKQIVPAEAKKLGVKLLGDGDVTRAYIVKVQTSKSAAEKIVNAGGRVERDF